MSQVAATGGFANPGCDNLQSDLWWAYQTDMQPDVYTRSIQEPVLQSYFTQMDKMVSFMMVDSSSRNEDDLFVLTAVAFSLDFVQ